MLLPCKTYAFTNQPTNRLDFPAALNNFNSYFDDSHRQVFVIIIQAL